MLTNNDLITLGFKKYQHFTVMNSVFLDLGRNRILTAGCIGTTNEVICICEKSKVGNNFTDMICIHNYDYDGYITIDRIKLIVDWFSAKKA